MEKDNLIPEFQFDLEDVGVLEDVKPVEEVEETPVEDTVVETTPAEEIKEEVPKEANETALGIYKTLIDKGYTSEREGFKGTYEELDEIFEELPEVIFQGVFSTFPEPTQKLLQYAFAKQEGVTWEELTKFVTEYSSPVETDIDISDPDKQRDFLLKELVAEGMDKEDALDTIDVWEDKEKLEDVSKKYLDKRKAKSEKQINQTIAEAEKEKARKKKEAKDFTNNIVSEINSTSWNAKRKNVVLDEIRTGQINEKSKVINTSPKALIQLADFYTYFDPKTGEFNLEAYKKQGLSSAVKDIKTNIEKNFKTDTKSVEVEDKPKNFDSSKYEFEI